MIKGQAHISAMPHRVRVTPKAIESESLDSVQVIIIVIVTTVLVTVRTILVVAVVRILVISVRTIAFHPLGRTSSRVKM